MIDVGEDTAEQKHSVSFIYIKKALLTEGSTFNFRVCGS